MRFYGWAVLILLFVFGMSAGLYYAYGRINHEELFIEKTPVFNVKNNGYEEYDKNFVKLRNINSFAFELVDYEYFIGKMKYDLLNSTIYIEPLTKDMYEELKGLAKAIYPDFIENKESRKIGEKVKVYFNNFYSEGIKIKYSPQIFILDLDSVEPEIIDNLKNTYFILTKEEVYSQSELNKYIIESLGAYGGFLIDDNTAGIPVVARILSYLQSNGVLLRKDFKILKFKR